MVQKKSPVVKSDREPIAVTVKGLHDPIVNQYRPRHSMCGCCWPAAQAADCWEIVNAYGVSDMVVLQAGLLRKILTSQPFCDAQGSGDRAEGRLWPCSAPRDGSDGIKLTNRTTRSSAAQIVVGEIVLSGAIHAGPQACNGPFYKNCAFAREHTVSTTALPGRGGRAPSGPPNRLGSPIWAGRPAVRWGPTLGAPRPSGEPGTLTLDLCGRGGIHEHSSPDDGRARPRQAAVGSGARVDGGRRHARPRARQRVLAAGGAALRGLHQETAGHGAQCHTSPDLRRAARSVSGQRKSPGL